MFKLEKGLYDYFLWLDIESKYQMKKLVRYGEIEEEFINDLLKNKVIVAKYNNINYHTYQEILNDRNVNSNDIVLIRTLCKYIYDRDIEDYSDYGYSLSKIVID